ncbi:MAG: transposase [Gloeobacterales cyanobacterium]
MRFSKLDYCHYLLSSPINYTLTHLADHLETVSHDAINRYLRREKLTPRLLWNQVAPTLLSNPDAYLVFDDTVIDKRFSNHIELVRRLYSGAEHRVIRGIGLISCLYVNPHTEQFWIIDYRLYEPDGDGKSKLDHLLDMFSQVLEHKALPFRAVLMDSWYAAQKVMAAIDNANKIYYCPLKRNRHVDDSGGRTAYQRIDQLNWSEEEIERGKPVKIRKFPGAKKVRLFRVTVSTNRTEYVATNDETQLSREDTQQVCSHRWKIEEFHREIKQLTGIERCQCRKARIQRNHIACALLVWSHLKQRAYETGKTVYEQVRGVMSDYLRKELRQPTIPMVFA